MDANQDDGTNSADLSDTPEMRGLLETLRASKNPAAQLERLVAIALEGEDGGTNGARDDGEQGPRGGS
jgi:hypothetical protein